MGIVEIITIIFVICKVMGIGAVANWTWLQILMPQIIVTVFYICFFIAVCLFVKLRIR